MRENSNLRSEDMSKKVWNASIGQEDYDYCFWNICGVV